MSSSRQGHDLAAFILARSGIASVRIRDNDETVIASVVTLLERQRLFGTGNR